MVVVVATPAVAADNTVIVIHSVIPHFMLCIPFTFSLCLHDPVTNALSHQPETPWFKSRAGYV